jgi:hypothetical protein
MSGRLRVEEPVGFLGLLEPPAVREEPLTEMPCLECGLHGLKADPSARADDEDCRHGGDLPFGVWRSTVRMVKSVSAHH